jgi:hypothetical protein
MRIFVTGATGALSAKREHPGREVLPRDARDPDVVRVKAFARSRLTGSSRSSRTQ